MDSTLHQGTFGFVEASSSKLGNEMPKCGDDTKNTECRSYPSSGRSSTADVDEIDHAKSCAIESGDALPTVKHVGGKVQFCSEFAQEAFSKLTKRQAEYICTYLETTSPSLTAKRLGLTSAKTCGKEIKRIATAKLRFASLAEMLRDAGVTADRTTASQKQLMQQLEEQGYRCSLTGIKLTPETARLDHKHPVAEGGEHAIENLHWVTDDVNKAKGTMSVDAFVSMCISVADWARR